MFETTHASFRLQRRPAKTCEVLTGARQELRASEARLWQELDQDTAETVARLEATAHEREFRYEIVRSELTNTEKTNAESAAALLFLARAGVLTTLDQEALIAQGC